MMGMNNFLHNDFPLEFLRFISCSREYSRTPSSLKPIRITFMATKRSRNVSTALNIWEKVPWAMTSLRQYRLNRSGNDFPIRRCPISFVGSLLGILYGLYMVETGSDLFASISEKECFKWQVFLKSRLAVLLLWWSTLISAMTLAADTPVGNENAMVPAQLHNKLRSCSNNFGSTTPPLCQVTSSP